jgi:quercetin dioxygenase-like cupin family protein
MPPQETGARVLALVDECLAAAREGQSGALWRLAEQGRQLDANLVRLLPGTSVARHSEGVLDVLVAVVHGGGLLDDGTDDPQELRPGCLVWLPRGAARGLSAGPAGLTYLSVHVRRPGMSVSRRSGEAGTAVGPAVGPAEGGEAPCALDRVCPECGRMRAEASAPYCSWCGERLSLPDPTHPVTP